MSNPQDMDIFGYSFENEDIDHLNSTATEAVMLGDGDLPEIVDPRNSPLAEEGWLKVEDQGRQGSCQGQALSECLEFCYAVLFGIVIQISRQYAYIRSQQLSGKIRTDSGSTLSGGTKCAEEGVPLEKDGPYQSRYPGWQWLTDEMRQKAKDFRLKSHTVMRSSSDVVRFIGSGIGIVQIGIAWGSEMQPDRYGCIRRFTGRGGGGHSVVFCGYVPDRIVGQRSTTGRWLLMKNSWSKRWGINGYAYVDESAVNSMFRHPHTVMIGRTDMETPEPRTVPYDFTKEGNSAYG